jgi:hypothetical protein
MEDHNVIMKRFGMNLATASTQYSSSVTYKEWLVEQPNI